MANNRTIERPPVVVVLGHVDHGKSTLLDCIRKTNFVEKESGGITQHIGAYEIIHTDEDGRERRITFIDTPGHAAFSKMRERGASAADIAILVVAADDGVKPQTLEALEAIKKSGSPFIVAITKIDKENANSDKAKQTLAEAGVYVEGYGGNVSAVPVSGKTGEGVPNLLSLILLQSSLLDLKADAEGAAKGVIIESHRDGKRGSLATVIIRSGALKRGEAAQAGGAYAVVRTMHDWTGKQVESARPSTPVLISGWSEPPAIGETLRVWPSKKEAEQMAEKTASDSKTAAGKEKIEKELTIPIVLRTDAAGTLEAIAAEFKKRETEKLSLKLLLGDIGGVAESDIKLLLGSRNPLVLGFNVPVDRHAADLAEKNVVPIMLFDVIYKLTEWLDKYIAKVTPEEIAETVAGEAKILKTFSRTRDRQVVGGGVLSGELVRGKKVRFKRVDEILCEGKIVNLQRQRVDIDKVVEGEQFGAVIESKCELAEGDIIEIVA